MQRRVSDHELCARFADRGTILEKLNLGHLSMRASLIEAILHGFKTNSIALEAVVNALLELNRGSHFHILSDLLSFKSSKDNAGMMNPDDRAFILYQRPYSDDSSSLSPLEMSLPSSSKSSSTWEISIRFGSLFPDFDGE